LLLYNFPGEEKFKLHENTNPDNQENREEYSIAINEEKAK